MRTKQGTKGSWNRCNEDKDKARDKDGANEGQDKDKVKGRNDGCWVEQQFATNVTKRGTKRGWLVENKEPWTRSSSHWARDLDPCTLYSRIMGNPDIRQK